MLSDKKHQILRKLKNQTWLNVSDDKSTQSVLNFTSELLERPCYANKHCGYNLLESRLFVFNVFIYYLFIID